MRQACRSMRQHADRCDRHAGRADRHANRTDRPCSMGGKPRAMALSDDRVDEAFPWLLVPLGRRRFRWRRAGASSHLLEPHHLPGFFRANAACALRRITARTGYPPVVGWSGPSTMGTPSVVTSMAPRTIGAGNPRSGPSRGIRPPSTRAPTRSASRETRHVVATNASNAPPGKQLACGPRATARVSVVSHGEASTRVGHTASPTGSTSPRRSGRPMCPPSPAATSVARAPSTMGTSMPPRTAR